MSAAAVLMVTIAGTVHSPARVRSKARPLTTSRSFCIVAENVAQALGTALIYVTGRPAARCYLALPNLKGSALLDRKDGLHENSGAADSRAGKAIGKRLALLQLLACIRIFTTVVLASAGGAVVAAQREDVAMARLDWGTYLGDNTMSTTILDRLMHHCHLLEFDERSYRLKEAAEDLAREAMSS